MAWTRAPRNLARSVRFAITTKHLTPSCSLAFSISMMRLASPVSLASPWLDPCLARGVGPSTEAICHSVVLSRDIYDAEVELGERLVPPGPPCRWSREGVSTCSLCQLCKD